MYEKIIYEIGNGEIITFNKPSEKLKIENYLEYYKLKEIKN